MREVGQLNQTIAALEKQMQEDAVRTQCEREARRAALERLEKAIVNFDWQKFLTEKLRSEQTSTP